MTASDIYDYSRIKCLDQIKKDKDVRHITRAVYPGFHCPLYTATNLFASIDRLAVLIIGTEECTYYSRCREGFYDKNNFFSLVLDKHDITFGFSKGLLSAVEKVKKLNEFDALVIITTCVVELIGEEISSIIDEINRDKSFIVLLVKTNHYQIDTPTIGLEEGLKALVFLMESHERIDGTVNILGPRQDGFEQSELAAILKRNGISINTRIPDKCTIQTIRFATSAELNIVTHYSALKIAKCMKEKFGIEYVYFDSFSDPYRIRGSYLDLQRILKIDILAEIDELFNKVLSEMVKIKPLSQNKSFIISMPPMFSYEIASFLCKIGMKPLWLQTLGLKGHDDKYVKEILSFGHNPKICRAINKAPLDAVFQSEKPDIYFSGDFHDHNSKNEPGIITLNKELKGRGFEIPLKILNRLSIYFEKRQI